MMESTRRYFLGGIAAAAVPAPAIASKGSAEMTARERFDYHYSELVKAMDEVTDGYDGWELYAGARRPVAGRDAVRHKKVGLVRFEVTGSPPIVIERHETM